MAIPSLSVEGADFVKRVAEAEELTQRLQRNQWDFENAPEVVQQRAACDVLAKEITVVHDGRVQTRVGRLVMRGEGRSFNLMGAEPATATFKRTSSILLDEVNRQIGSRGLHDFDEISARSVQKVEMFNYDNFYQLRDIVFWAALNKCGLSPAGFQFLDRHVAEGRIVHNVRFEPLIVGDDGPADMQATCLMVRFPTTTIEWMERPVFGGMARETVHIVNLLTTERSRASHPFLPLVAAGEIEVCGQPFHLRRFAGRSPKEALEGPKQAE